MREGYKDSSWGIIPNEWGFSKVEEILEEYQNGYAFSAKGYVEDGIPIISMAMISLQGRFQFDALKCKRWKTIEEQSLNRYILNKGDLIIAMTDVTPNKDLIGKMAVINTEGKFLLNQRVGWLKLKNELIDTYYLSYIGNSENWLRNCRNIASQGAQANIGTKQIIESYIPLPPLPEQQKIAEILSTVDAKIDVIDQQITETQALKKGLMQRLLTKGIGHTEFKDSALGEIPKCWEVVKFGDTLSQTPEYGANASAKQYHLGFYRYIRITDILENGKLTTSNYVGISNDEGKQYELIENDILIARTGNTVGKSYLYSKEDGLCSFAGYLIRFRCDEKRLNPKFIVQFLHSDLFWNWVKSIVRTGAQPNINSKEYQSMLIPLPNILEQQKISEILCSVDDKLEVLSEKKTHYQELKQGLMQKLLTGNIRVKID
jgi:type I restriction enzyme S subunit